MQDDLNFDSNQYSIILLVFFIAYLLMEVPSNMILNRVRPSRYLPALAVLWGIVATCMGAVSNWRQLIGLRVLLGLFEAGFAPGCAFYLSSWYRRNELASRYAWLYTSVALAGAFSGLLAGVITEYMDGTGGIAGWRWLFILEGLASVVVGAAVFFIMPDYPTSTKSKFLTEDERIIACNRLAMDGKHIYYCKAHVTNCTTGIALTQGAHSKVGEWKAFKMTVRDWRTWCLCLLFVLGTSSQTMQYFLPGIVKTLGWKGHLAQCKSMLKMTSTQLTVTDMTIPSYAFATICILAACFLADRIKMIWPVLAGLSGFGFIFFIATTIATNPTTRYVLAIFAFGAIYGCSPLTKTWVSLTLSHPAEKRAIAIALINGIGNASSIYGSFLWPDSDRPRYLTGFGTTTAWMGALSVFTVIFAFLFKKFPQERPEHDAVMAAQLKAERDEQHRKTHA